MTPNLSTQVGKRQKRLEKEGDYIGPFKLLRQIGEGGFGVVWHAKQSNPFDREVALKVIKVGMNTDEVIERFEAERKVLSMMDHPYIAKVLDAGETDLGLPFFAMELVRGTPITEYCDNNKLSIRDRLALAIQVCHGLQHAHQKGILHRDLKPSNILVEEVDNKPVPQIIDFGIYKALSNENDPDLPENRTQEGTILGTFQYMSPEQAGSEPDLDTRSDIYSLGVVIYELLTGSPCLTNESIKNSPHDLILQRIREEEPPRASSRILSEANIRETIAIFRDSDSSRLSKALRGDLDWVMAKVLEKDRSRRYDSASDLAADIERHLNNEPVEASPPSALYRFSKLVRRNRLAVGSAAVISLLLIAGVGASTWQAIRATKAEGKALAEKERAENAEELALNRLSQVVAEKQRADEMSKIATAQRDSALNARSALEQSERAAKTAEEKAKELTAITASWLNELLVKVDIEHRQNTLSEIESRLPSLYLALQPKENLQDQFSILSELASKGKATLSEVIAFDEQARFAEALAQEKSERDTISSYRNWVRLWRVEILVRDKNYRFLVNELEMLRPALDSIVEIKTREEIEERIERLLGILSPKFADVAASSTLPDQGTNNYLPSNVIDGRPETAWVSAVGDNERWIKVSFQNHTLLTNIRIAPGYFKSQESFQGNGSIKRVEFEFSDGTTESFDLLREFRIQDCRLSPPVITEWVRVRILSSFAGNRQAWAKDVPLSMLEFHQ